MNEASPCFNSKEFYFLVFSSPLIVFLLDDPWCDLVVSCIQEQLWGVGPKPGDAVGAGHLLPAGRRPHLQQERILDAARTLPELRRQR